MKDVVATASFVTELRRVLRHLYDPAELRKSPLLEIFDEAHKRPSTLRRTLTDAIQNMKPEPSIPSCSNAWRIYHTLSWRFVEQSGQKQVAANLAISPRQLRRLEQLSVQELADNLWTRFDLEHMRHPAAPTAREGDRPDALNAETSGRERELEWLRKSLPSEVVDISKVVKASLETADPLMRELGVQAEYKIPDNPPLMAGQLAPIHQALLNVLTAIARSVPGGRLEIAVENQQRGLCVHVRPTTRGPVHQLPNSDFTEMLNMAHQLIGLLGGTLEISPVQGREQVPAVTLVLSVAQQITVLMIDDNADTLQLFERRLSESRYRFIGARDPEQALDLAEEMAPQIILLDVMLPDVDGWELLGRLREHPATRDAPILICTILPQEQLALTLGAAAFIRKPVSREALLSALDHVSQLRESC